jgi:16S rRNA (cytosine967-C5)-methyltransferase
LQADDLHRAAVRQGKLLRNAAERVAPGGSLVYSVCSMEPEEGEQVVVSFLQSRGDFRIADPRPNLPEPCRRFTGKDRMVRTSPADGEWDGFFAALLVREA